MWIGVITCGVTVGARPWSHVSLCTCAHVRARACVHVCIHVCVLRACGHHRPSTTICRQVAVHLQRLSSRVDGIDAICVGATVLDISTICWRCTCQLDCCRLSEHCIYADNHTQYSVRASECVLCANTRDRTNASVLACVGLTRHNK